MLFLTYWELNENMPAAERLQVAQRLMSSGLFPPKGVNLIRFDVTPDAWGILIYEAENAADVDRAIYIWRAAGAGFFKSTKTSSAMPIQEHAPVVAELLKAVASA